ncbi:MAG: response regulator [Steroidobacteraceae bacterium]
MADNFEVVDILLVEDSESDAELTLRALRKARLANNVVWVKDGQEALDFLYSEGTYADRGQTRPKLVFLDLKLPRLNGIDVLRRIKGDEAKKTIPVVMLTSSNEERDIVESYALGVNSYLTKPVEFDKLGEQVVNAGLYWLLANKVPSS